MGHSCVCVCVWPARKSFAIPRHSGSHQCGGVPRLPYNSAGMHVQSGQCVCVCVSGCCYSHAHSFSLSLSVDKSYPGWQESASVCVCVCICLCEAQRCRRAAVVDNLCRVRAPLCANVSYTFTLFTGYRLQVVETVLVFIKRTACALMAVCLIGSAYARGGTWLARL